MIKVWNQTRRNAIARRTAQSKGKRNPKAGFSLMEVLIVLMIMGLLVALIGPNLMKRFSAAEAKTATVQIKMLKQALDTMHLEIGRYPTQQEGLALLQQSPGAGVAGWSGPYLTDGGVPNDPWKNPYIYMAPADGGQPQVSSLGKDAKPGGTGADADIVG